MFVAFAAMGCASKEEVTPTIVVSPGAKERIMTMDRVRHHGSPRRWLPKVTVEEVDDAELPTDIESPTGDPPTSAESATEDESAERDAGASRSEAPSWR